MTDLQLLSLVGLIMTVSFAIGYILMRMDNRHCKEMDQVYREFYKIHDSINAQYDKQVLYLNQILSHFGWEWEHSSGNHWTIVDQLTRQPIDLTGVPADQDLVTQMENMFDA